MNFQKTRLCLLALVACAAIAAGVWADDPASDVWNFSSPALSPPVTGTQFPRLQQPRRSGLSGGSMRLFFSANGAPESEPAAVEGSDVDRWSGQKQASGRPNAAAGSRASAETSTVKDSSSPAPAARRFRMEIRPADQTKTRPAPTDDPAGEVFIAPHADDDRTVPAVIPADHTVVESDSGSESAIRPVAAVREPPSAFPAAGGEDDVPVLSFDTPEMSDEDDADLPDFSEFESPDLGSDSGLSNHADAPADENVTAGESSGAADAAVPDTDFSQADPDARAFLEGDTPASAVLSSGKSADASASVLPHTDISGLPTTHTGAQTPTVQARWVGADTLNVGQQTRCSLTVTNTGSSLVRNVVLEAAVPPGIDVVSARPAAHPGTARWSVGDLSPGGEFMVDLVLLPRRRGNTALNAFVRFTGYATSAVAVQEPVLELNLAGPSETTVGEQAGYIVTVHNSGTGAAANVVIEARVPEELLHRSGSVPKILVGTLNPGESRQVRFNLTAVKGGTAPLAVRAVADGGLMDEAGAEISVAEPRLEVTVAGPSEGAVGQPDVYEVVVTNTGNVPSINVRTKYKIPVGFEFVKADHGGVYVAKDHLVDWFAGTLQPGDSSRYSVTLTARKPGNSVHRAGAVSEHTSAVLASCSVPVEGLPELHLAVASDQPAVAVGDESVVQITVQNRGSVPARRTGLSCELPSGLEFSAAAGPSEYIADNGVVIFRSLPALAAGESVTYRLRVRCERNGQHRIRVRVASESLNEPVIGEQHIAVSAAR